jgi:regulator of protease activity HflC (stomatin/prohibitin superfamily)
MNSAVIIIAVIVIAIGVAVGQLLGQPVIGGVIILLGIILALTLRTAAEWERAVVLRLGRFAGVRGPGLYFLIPAFETVYATVDTRRQSTRISAEDTLTSDAVSVTMDSIMFWRVQDVKRAATELSDYRGMIAQIAQTSLREVISGTTLSDILSEREAMDTKLREYITRKSEGWGIGEIAVEIRDVRIPPELNDAMSRNAQAEKEKQARVTLASAEVAIAQQIAPDGPDLRHEQRSWRNDPGSHRHGQRPRRLDRVERQQSEYVPAGALALHAQYRLGAIHLEQHPIKWNH